eukprot:scaffold117103_cov51-Phaeocystis_antarctica.AAC.2
MLSRVAMRHMLTRHAPALGPGGSTTQLYSEVDLDMYAPGEPSGLARSRRRAARSRWNTAWVFERAARSRLDLAGARRSRHQGRRAARPPLERRDSPEAGEAGSRRRAPIGSSGHACVRPDAPVSFSALAQWSPATDGAGARLLANSREGIGLQPPDTGAGAPAGRAVRAGCVAGEQGRLRGNRAIVRSCAAGREERAGWAGWACGGGPGRRRRRR